jgi:hypothetical protein
MTPQQLIPVSPLSVIPNKRYRHLDFPEVIYEGRGETDQDTLDCINKRMVRLVTIDGQTKERYVSPPFLKNSMPGFWDKFIPINA